MSETPKYLLKAKQTYNFHREKLVANAAWRLSDTARVLRRSIGSISEDLKIAKAIKDFPQLEQLETAYESLKLIRKYKKQTEYLDEI